MEANVIKINSNKVQVHISLKRMRIVHCSNPANIYLRALPKGAT